jgi:predicted transcriptional regulator
MELEVMRAELARTILNEEDEDLLSKILAMIHKEKKTILPFPCQMTVEELKADVRKSLEDIRNGRVTNHEDLEKEILLW